MSEIKKVISDLMNILNRKARYHWSQSGLQLKLIAEMDWQDQSGSGTHILAPDVHVVERIHEWCYTNNYGHRNSYDTFKFRNKKQITMFLLRWGEVKDE